MLLELCLLWTLCTGVSIAATGDQPDSERPKLDVSNLYPVVAGPPGTSGIPGIPGNPGMPGRDGVRGEKGDPGTCDCAGRGRNVKQCSWKELNNGVDSGRIAGCTFNKNRDDSTVMVLFNGAMRVKSGAAACKRWFFTFNGAECADPMTIEAMVYMDTELSINIHRAGTVQGLCDGIKRGVVDVALWVEDCEGYSNGDSATGWNSVSRLIIEEIETSMNP
ncbi:CTHRC1 [Branchiostoma lanceolatum]|uniref:CTHRC1 protein n=1 Tax=Branchiostoma lanceolatum TaxID=7740 RepID=A0A8J9ZHL4_BRALA|nr:CTHRC1 [Branchiostoma lanceolatum]